MADEQEPEQPADRDSGGIGAGLFNPLTDSLDDLIRDHQDRWAWPEVAVDVQDLVSLAASAGETLSALATPETPPWAAKAALGIARSITAIHEHADRHGGYATAARSLWTSFIPSAEPTLSDAQIYALLAIVEARTSAEAFCAIASGIDDELQRNAIGHDEADEITWLRGEIAQWEREAWRWADQTKAAVERFLLLATFAASSPSPAALQKAELQVAMLNRRLAEVQAAVAPYRAGRKPGAVSKLTRALIALVERAGSPDFDAVFALIEKACYDEPVEGIQFQDCNDHKVWYQDVVTGLEDHTTVANLRRRLTRLPAI
jgi:hypothetical protein